MEPGGIPSANPSPEMGGRGRVPEIPTNPDVSSERHAVETERVAGLEGAPEGQKVPTSATQPFSAPPMLPAPQPASVQPQTDDTNPVLAADEDLVEKEWVDKAKKIVAQTKDDPYTQEVEVSKLQADYLKKRYGKEVKLSSDS